MNKEKIAVLVDSCADVPKEFIERYGIYVVHTCISYVSKTYIDGVDITAKEVLEVRK
jgi:fatty acid-binding protein DegV